MSLLRMMRFASADLAIDLGTANTVVYLRDHGVVLAEPSVVAIETNNGVRRIRAVGDDAKLMMGKTPANLQTIRPLRNGVLRSNRQTAAFRRALSATHSGLPGAVFACRR